MLNPATCLTIWEAGHGVDPLDQTYHLLQAEYPEASFEQLEQLTVGQANARLLGMMQAFDGAKALTLEQACPSCKTLMSVELTYEELLANHQDDRVDGTCTIGDYHIQFRHPTLNDMAQAAASDTDTSAERHMLEQCLKISKKDIFCAISEVPEETIKQAAEHIEQQDPLAVIEIGLRCADCKHEWTSMLDPGKALWRKVDKKAKKLLTEIAKLTRTYGWTEEYILSMSPAKREFYLEIAESGKL